MSDKPKRRTLEEQIASAQEELKQKEARVKELLGRQRSKTDKDRTHRLCRRGGLMEKLLPKLATITDKQFEVFVENFLLTADVEKALDALDAPTPTAPQTDTALSVGEPAAKPESDTPKPAEAAAQTTQTQSARPTNAPNTNGANANRNNAPPNARPANQPHNNGTNGGNNGGNQHQRTS